MWPVPSKPGLRVTLLMVPFTTLGPRLSPPGKHPQLTNQFSLYLSTAFSQMDTQSVR